MKETWSGDHKRAEFIALKVKTMAGATGLSSTCQHTKAKWDQLHPERTQ